MKRLAIYCGSATPEDPRYIELATMVGTELARRGIGIVYGGGRLGLMGALADAALAAGGEVIGVIPHEMVSREVAHHGCTQLEVVGSMHERKARFTELADGFVTLPGGVGTLDELFEMITWNDLSIHDKPIVLCHDDGFWDPLLQWLERARSAGAIRPIATRRLHVAQSLPEALQVLRRELAAGLQKSQ